MDFNQVASKETLEKVKIALESNGFKVIMAANGAEAKTKALELIPEGAEVMTMTSITNETIGLAPEINDSGKYNALRPKLYNPETPAAEKKRIGAIPQYVTGSVHAITLDGKVMVASGTGSQLPAYTYGADKVIWVVGGQKIVTDEAAGKERIFKHIVPLESVRGRKAYNLPETWNTFPSKVVTFNREATPDRITIILVNEALGF
jgi:hypothetical protein